MTSALIVLSAASAALPQDDVSLHGAGPGAIPSAGVLIPEDIQLVCERVRAIMSNTPGTFVESIDGIFYEEELPPEDAGCLVLVAGSWSDLEGSADPIERLVEILAADGWKESPQSSADGPDGTRVTLSNGNVACTIHGQWDGGDDADSTYVPSDVYQVIVRCGRVAPKGSLEEPD